MNRRLAKFQVWWLVAAGWCACIGWWGIPRLFWVTSDVLWHATWASASGLCLLASRRPRAGIICGPILAMLFIGRAVSSAWTPGPWNDQRSTALVTFLMQAVSALVVAASGATVAEEEEDGMGERGR